MKSFLVFLLSVTSERPWRLPGPEYGPGARHINWLFMEYTIQAKAPACIHTALR